MARPARRRRGPGSVTVELTAARQTTGPGPVNRSELETFHNHAAMMNVSLSVEPGHPSLIGPGQWRSPGRWERELEEACHGELLRWPLLVSISTGVPVCQSVSSSLAPASGGARAGCCPNVKRRDILRPVRT